MTIKPFTWGDFGGGVGGGGFLEEDVSSSEDLMSIKEVNIPAH